MVIAPSCQGWLAWVGLDFELGLRVVVAMRVGEEVVGWGGGGGAGL